MKLDNSVTEIYQNEKWICHQALLRGFRISPDVPGTKSNKFQSIHIKFCLLVYLNLLVWLGEQQELGGDILNTTAGYL